MNTYHKYICAVLFFIFCISSSVNSQISVNVPPTQAVTSASPPATTGLLWTRSSDGKVFKYNTTIAAWLSVEAFQLWGGSNAASIAVDTTPGWGWAATLWSDPGTGISRGPAAPYNLAITRVVVQTSTAPTSGQILIRESTDAVTLKATLTGWDTTTEVWTSAQDAEIPVEFDQGQRLGVLFDHTGSNFDYPGVMLEIHERVEP